MRPLLTIGLPTYNSRAWLPLSVGSIFSQTFQDWELIAVDDGSHDESHSVLQLLRDPRVTVISWKQRLGLAARLNEITSLARGKYLARMDADDFMHPARLESQMSFLERSPEIDGVGCGMIIVDRSLRPVGMRTYPGQHEQICANPFRGISIAHATFIGRTEWWRRHPYNESNRVCEDWELWTSCYANSRFANLSDPLYFYRVFDSFSAKREVAAHLAMARLKWTRRAEYGAGRSAAACFAHVARSTLIAAASAIGLGDHVIHSRSMPLDDAAVNLYRSGLKTILEQYPAAGEGLDISAVLSSAAGG